MSVQTESFQAAWTRLSSPGHDLVRASFEIGWELVHIAHAFDEAPKPLTKSTGNYQEIFAAEGLTDTEEIQVRVARIGATLLYFNKQQGQLPSGTDLALPSLGGLQAAFDAKTDDIGSELVALHVAMVKACTALDGTAGANQADSPDLPVNGLKDSYEVGRLLAVVVHDASNAATENDFKNCVSIAPGKTAGQQETVAVRAHSMLGGLRDCFPSAASYAVARHLEDWSAWVNGKPVDYSGTFDLAQAKIAIVGQGRVWRAILSGQTLARDYIVAASLADAANRLFVGWAASATAIARSFVRTALARFFLVLGIVVLLVFVGAFLLDLLTQGGATSGAKNGLAITAVLASAASAAGIFHVSRTQVTSALSDIWSIVEPPMIEAELVESIALSTRRLPLDTVGGAAPPLRRGRG